MLVINQRLDKLAAMRSDFVARGMLLAGYSPNRDSKTPCGLRPQQPGSKRSCADEQDDNDDDNEGPVDSDDALGRVVLGRRHGTYTYLATRIY